MRSWFFNSVRVVSCTCIGTFQALDHSLNINSTNENKKITWARAQQHKTIWTTCNQDYCYLFWFVPRLEFVVFSFLEFFMRLNKCDFTRSIFLFRSLVVVVAFFGVHFLHAVLLSKEQMNLLLPFVQFNYQWAWNRT